MADIGHATKSLEGTGATFDFFLRGKSIQNASTIYDFASETAGNPCSKRASFL